jgi:hypothetical protein
LAFAIRERHAGSEYYFEQTNYRLISRGKKADRSKGFVRQKKKKSEYTRIAKYRRNKENKEKE